MSTHQPARTLQCCSNDPWGSGKVRQKGTMSLKPFRSMLVPAMTIVLSGVVVPLEASANVFGQCARQSNLEMKIASCIEASKSTSYPWILHWVYRELARAHRERRETQRAIASYAQSLAAAEHESVRREMEDLAAHAVTSLAH